MRNLACMQTYKGEHLVGRKKVSTCISHAQGGVSPLEVDIGPKVKAARDAEGQAGVSCS